ncbi:unnamed protein product, partial [Effrenium voratum]
VFVLREEVAEMPRIQSLLDAAEKRLLKDDQAQKQLGKMRHTLREESQMALTFAAQDAKESEDMLRSALAAETTSLILVQSEVERSEAAMRDLEERSFREAAALQSLREQEADVSAERLAEAEAALRLIQEGEKALAALADEKVEAAEARAELLQEKSARAAELRAANWFYFGEARAWAEGESAETTALDASRKEEARAVQSHESFFHAAAAEASAFKVEAAAMRKEALGLRSDLSKEEAAFQQALAWRQTELSYSRSDARRGRACTCGRVCNAPICSDRGTG